MELCSRCHKRLPVVYITKFDNGKMQNEGLCIKCAKELGIAQVDQVIKQLGLSEEDIDRMNTEIDPDSELLSLEEIDDEDTEDGKAPPIDFKKLFGGAMMGPINASGNEEADGPAPSDAKTDGKKKKSKKKFLDTYCQDLTKKAASGEMDAVIGRERELARLIQILCRRQKNNPCLIGEPGVGKTAIAEALAQRIVSGDVPYKLADKEVHLLDLTALVAGTQFRGQFETRMKGLIDEVKRLGNIILVIDEVHSIASAGDAEGSMNAANILKPALSRGEIQVIGATTLAEYRKYIEKDAALERRFQPITVEEPSLDDTVKVLRGIKKYYEDFHGIKIPDSVVHRAAILSERYITDRFLPDKAIDLLDEAASYRSLSSPEIGELKKADDELRLVTEEREALEAPAAPSDSQSEDENKYHRLADLKVKEIRLREQRDSLEAKQRDIELTTEDLAHVIEVWTGIPASSITENEFKKIDRLETNLKAHIIGQDEAVSLVTRAIKRSRAGVSYKRKPVSFIFAGPTGVGKTELVKRLSSELFNSPETLIRLDMSEFMEKHSVSRIIGAPPGYVGYDEAGQLTEKIRRKPYSVILFDEIEKAHPDVLNILLQLLDDGHITDAHGKKVNFENTVIVMTTNAGSQNVSATAGFSESEKKPADDRTMKALSEFLRPEFINRVDEIVTFRQLDRDNFAHIAVLMLDELKLSLGEKDIAFTYTDAAARYIADRSFSTKFGARNMRRMIQREVEDKIAEKIISDYNGSISAISLDASEDNLIIGCV